MRDIMKMIERLNDIINMMLTDIYRNDNVVIVLILLLILLIEHGPAIFAKRPGDRRATIRAIETLIRTRNHRNRLNIRNGIKAHQPTLFVCGQCRVCCVADRTIKRRRRRPPGRPWNITPHSITRPIYKRIYRGQGFQMHFVYIRLFVVHFIGDIPP